MVAVSPTAVKPTHHISLSDGTTTIGLTLTDGNGRMVNTLARSGFPRTALRMGTGAVGYGDFEPPFSPLVQSDWAGGRGLEDFDTDSTRYFDSYRVDTTKGDIILGPKETYTTGYYTTYNLASASTYSLSIDQSAGTPATIEYASPYTTTGAIEISRVKCQITLGDTPPASGIYAASYRCRMILYSDNAGAPDAVLAVSGYMDIPYLDYVSPSYYYFNLNYILQSTTTYWFALESTQPNRISLRIESTTPAGHATFTRSNGGAWSQYIHLTDGSLDFRLETVGSGEAIYFKYREQLYAAVNSDSHYVRIMMNGYRGVADATNTDKRYLKLDIGLSVSLAGKIVKIVKGKGAGEDQNWRVITSNTITGTDDTLTVDPPWKINHDNTSEYVILGCDTWQDVRLMTGGADYYAAPLKIVTDVCVSDDVVHFAQGYGKGYDAGDSIIVDMCVDNNAGTLRTRFRENGTNRAKYLIRVVNDANKVQIWRASINETTESFNDVSRATAVKYGTDMTFGTAISCGSEDEPITGLTTYGDPAIPYILKEGSFGSIKSDVYAEIPVSEMQSVSSEDNGRASLRHGVYLYFSLLDGLERYYDQQLDDIGPNRDEGMPVGRQGPIRDILGYPGRIYYCIDGGPNGNSCIMCYNMSGHHEIYRGQFGKRIRRLFIQVLPGTTVDRLWFSEDEDLVYLPVALHPRKTTGYKYTSSGFVISSWMYGSLKDVQKYFHSMTMFTEKLSTANSITVLAYYQTDNEDETNTWHSFATYGANPVTEETLSDTNLVVGRRWRYKLVLSNPLYNLITPRVKAVVLNAVTRMPTKYVWTVNFQVKDEAKDLNGKLYMADGKTLLDKLEEWADSSQRAAPVLVHSLHNEFDDCYMFLEPPTVRVMASKAVGATGQKMEAVGQMTMIKV